MKTSNRNWPTCTNSGKTFDKQSFDEGNDASGKESKACAEKELISYLDEQDSSSLPDALRRKWTRMAFRLSLVTAFVTLAISVASFLVCKETSSSSIFASAFDAVLGTVSSLAVAWRFRDELNGETIGARRERIATFGIGLSFVLTGIATIAASIINLTQTHHPRKTQDILIILWCSVAVYFLLAYTQYCLANKLNSQSMWAASVDSAIAAAMSFGICISTLIYRHFPSEMWWLDHAVALALGGISAGYGLYLISVVALCNREIFGRDKIIDYHKLPSQ